MIAGFERGKHFDFYNGLCFSLPPVILVLFLKFIFYEYVIARFERGEHLDFYNGWCFSVPPMILVHLFFCFCFKYECM